MGKLINTNKIKLSELLFTSGNHACTRNKRETITY